MFACAPFGRWDFGERRGLTKLPRTMLCSPQKHVSYKATLGADLASQNMIFFTTQSPDMAGQPLAVHACAMHPEQRRPEASGGARGARRKPPKTLLCHQPLLFKCGSFRAQAPQLSYTVRSACPRAPEHLLYCPTLSLMQTLG